MDIPNRKLADLLIERKVRLARESFLDFRKLVNKKLKIGWWQQELCEELELFYSDLVQGKRPKLVIQAPPQHGKSLVIIDFIAWLAGLMPDCMTIYSSFSERLGVRANLRLQRIYDSDIYKRVFPDLELGKKGSLSDGALRNKDILEYKGYEGYFRNTTVGGSVTGESLDLGVIDDPIKGRSAANSETVRNATWDWFTDDFLTRFSEDAGLLIILTRWHLDDPVGRLLEADDTVKLLTYKAIATEDEKHRKEGEALFPEHKSLGFLLERKKIMPSANWEALYQQSPVIIGGSIFSGVWFKRYEVVPRLAYRMAFVDTAQKTKERNDYTVFTHAGMGADGNIYILDVIRKKVDAVDLEQLIVDCYGDWKGFENGRFRGFYIEDKASGTGLIQQCRARHKIPVVAIQRSIDKYSRALDVQGYVQSGYVYLPYIAHWVKSFIEECELFSADDSHLHDDMVDTLIDCVAQMLGKFLVCLDTLEEKEKRKKEKLALLKYRRR